MRTCPGRSSGIVGSSSQKTSWAASARDGADRLVGRPAHVGVDHQGSVGTEPLAHGADPLDVLAKPRAAHLHLDRPEALGEVLLGLAEEPIQREQEVDPARVRLDPRMVAAEELPEREPASPGAEVPERDVHRRDREGGEAAPPDVVAAPPHPLPEGLDPLGVLADEQRPRDPRASARIAAPPTPTVYVYPRPSAPSAVRTRAVTSSKWVISPCVESERTTGRGMR